MHALVAPDADYHTCAKMSMSANGTLTQRCCQVHHAQAGAANGLLQGPWELAVVECLTGDWSAASGLCAPLTLACAIALDVVVLLSLCFQTRLPCLPLTALVGRCAVSLARGLLQLGFREHLNTSTRVVIKLVRLHTTDPNTGIACPASHCSPVAISLWVCPHHCLRATPYCPGAS